MNYWSKAALLFANPDAGYETATMTVAVCFMLFGVQGCAVGDATGAAGGGGVAGALSATVP